MTCSLLIIELQSLDNETEDQDLEFDPVKLTEITYEWFDFFSDLIKHFITYMENVLLISANLNLSMMNSITPILGLIRHMIIDETMNHFLFDLSKTPQFLSVIHRLLDKWPGMSFIQIHLLLDCVFIILLFHQSFQMYFHSLGMLFMESL